MTEHPHANSAEQQPNTAPANSGRAANTLRFLPPVAALGTAFVLQVILITDTVGRSLANRYDNPVFYAVGALLGISVASCFEGAAAYLMDLYHRHLLAGDSVWMLKLSMFGYVAFSAVAIHWWTSARQLPEVVAWLLAAMSASALWLWSRGSRWARRDQMRAAGQLDPALPRLSVAAKVMHPWRWLVTLYLISWEPVATVAEARARYEQWSTARLAHRAARAEQRRHRREQSRTKRVKAAPREQVPAPTTASVGEQAPEEQPTVVPITRRPALRKSAANRPAPGPAPSIEQLADALSRDPDYGQRSIGRPTAEQILRRVFGSCTSERARAAKDIHNARVEQMAGASA